jgi:hypothetical protein
MSNDDGYDNDIYNDDDNDDDANNDGIDHVKKSGADPNRQEDAESLRCKKCDIDFVVGTKGSSELKELCSKCHAAIRNILNECNTENGDGAMQSVQQQEPAEVI